MEKLHQEFADIKARLDRINDMLNQSEPELIMWQIFVDQQTRKRGK